MAIHAQSSCTLSTITDVEAVYTYYYLSDSTITIDEAPKDNVNPPGASTITVISDGNSYTWQITEPELNIQDDVIQTAVGKLYYIECVEFSDGTYDWGPLMTSSTYAAAKAAYNLSSQALSQAQAANDATALLGGHFLYNSTWQTTNTPHSANIVQTIEKNGIDVSSDPTKWDYNVHIGANGIRLRNNESVLSEWTSSALKFNNPSTGATQLTIGATGALQSGDFSISQNTSKFALLGTKIDLTYGEIYTPYFRVSQGSISGGPAAGVYITGNFEATNGKIGGTKQWDIKTFIDANTISFASMIGANKSFIQLGSSNTWLLNTDRLHTAWYVSGNYLSYPQLDSKYYDFGLKLPSTLNDKFLYIRYNSSSDLSTIYQNDSGWVYPFYIDGNGNIVTTGSIDAHSISIDGQSIAGGSLIAGSLASYGGSSTQPVYFPSSGTNQGKPVGITDSGGNAITIAQSVPSDSIWIKNVTTTGNGNAVTSVSFNSSTGIITATKGATYLTSYTETDPTVPTWAKASTKPSYSYDEITGTIPQSALPSYVDDVLEYNGLSNFPATGESGKIYVDISTNKTYRWGSTTYVEISSSLALGETSSTAYYGDRGKIAYDHANAKGSAFTSGLYKITTNSEGHVTAATAAGKSDIGLGNVDNKSSATIRSEITSTNITSALGFTPYDANNPNGYITSADVSDTHVNVSTRGSTKAYLLATTSSPTSTKTAREAVAETGVYLETSSSATRLIAPTFVGALTGTASGNLTSNSSLAWSKVTGADDLKAIENLSGTTGLLRKTAANTWELDTTNYLSSFTESDPVFSASAASSITNNDITNWNNKTSNTGTVTSVRVQASSPVKSSVTTAQSSSLNTTISLEDAYGDLKNPYGSKTARYVLAAPASAAGAPSFRALTNTDVGLSNVTNYSQITKIGDSGDGKLRVWTGDPDGTGYTDVTVHITAYDQSTVAKAAALDLSADVGSTKKPVYFKADGKPYAINYTIETSVPSGALFTDTTYTFASGTNGFTVTPKGGTAQTVAVTPSITNNVTGSGTSGKLVKWNGSNTITDGPAFTTGGTGYLKQDGTWGTPGGTYSLPIATYNALGGLKPWYSTTGASTLASGSSGAHSDTPSINARSSTAGKYYAVEIDKNGRLFVNVPWTNTNGSYLTSAVTTLTTQAGGHTTVTSVSGDVTIKIPTATSHLTNDSGYITGYVDEKVKLTSKSDSVAYKVILGPSSITSGTAYEGHYSTNLTYNPSTKALTTGGAVNGYTLAAASAKGVDTSIEASSSSVNLPTSAAVASFVEGKGYITSYTNTWRPIQVNGTQILGGTTSTNALNLKAGSNVSLTNSNGTVTIASTDTNTTYSLSGALSSHKFTSTLTAGGSGSGTSTSDFTLAAGTGISITDDTTNRKMTIACTVSNTDTLMTQAYSTTNNTYPLLMTASAGISSTSSRGATTGILNNGIYGNPSNGLINSLIYQMSAKAQMKYDATLDAIVFTFI